jgi:hypothetical protein
MREVASLRLPLSHSLCLPLPPAPRSLKPQVFPLRHSSAYVRSNSSTFCLSNGRSTSVISPD